MKTHDIVARCAKASESSDPMRAVRKVLEELAKELGDVKRCLGYISGIGGNPQQVFFRSPYLTLLKVCFPAAARTPPHDHGTWASILLLSGKEKNTLYRRENGSLRRAGERTLAPGEILNMREDTVHVVECIGARPTTGLHAYGGDILELPRRMWHPKTLREQRLDFDKYRQLARLAARAERAPLS